MVTSLEEIQVWSRSDRLPLVAWHWHYSAKSDLASKDVGHSLADIRERTVF